MVTATKTQRVQYMILHGEQEVAWIDTHGHCGILDEKFMPFNLYLEETDDDIDILVSNITNFYYWCATRVLPLDRKYAKEILNSIGASQALTDRDRARIALAYHCLCLTDIYWVREEREALTFAQVNLYDNHLSNAFVSVALRGRQITVQNDSLTRDLSTNGCFPKAWLWKQAGFELLKDGGRQVVENEVLASKVCQCFECRQVTYTEGIFEGEPVSIIGINQIREIDEGWFVGREQDYDMLQRRLDVLR